MNPKTHKKTGFEIAVIGMAGRFPGAKNIDEFWRNLKNGVESTTFFTDEELAEAGVKSELLDNPDFVKSNGSLLESKDYFDAAFFDYSPREAQILDPQQRLLHECAWHALEHAGYAPCSYDGLIGIYAGASPNFDWEALAVLSGSTSVLGAFASEHLTQRDYLCTRIAYKLNLKGPAVLVQTACSTSLVAIHLASRALLMGECDIALAGGVSVSYGSNSGYLFVEGMIGSSDGHCRAFDARSTGTIGGEGVGIVVLKRLKYALVDGDTIHAVIKGSGVNNDGLRKVGFTAPSILAQVELVKRVQRITQIEPESITYIEAHGTGTPLGDPIEVEALTRAFDTDQRQFCAIGSIKTNIGHLGTAAGAAGFIKTVLALKHKQIPPSLNCISPNPGIDFENSPFYVAAALIQWQNHDYPLRAGVNSLGIGGTNAHIILEEWPASPSPKAQRKEQGAGGNRQDTGSSEYQLMLLSTKTGSALEKQTGNLVQYLEENPGVNLADAAYTLQVGRKAFKHRKMWVIHPSSHDFSNPRTSVSNETNRLIFMFPGQGTQYANMGFELYRKLPLFRETLDHCFGILEPLLGYDIKETLYPSQEELTGAASKKINQTEISQPLIFVTEYALARLLMNWGIQPDAMIGHSIGEYAAACLAGVFLPEDALKLVVLRGKLMQRVPAGAMLSVSLPEGKLNEMLAQHPGAELAAVNAPSHCVVSGPYETIDELENKLKTQGCECRKLHTSHAFHSHMMDPILKQFEEAVKEIPLKTPQRPYISNLTGTWITNEEATSPGYWANHLRRTVRFGNGITHLLKEPNSIFIEVGPGRSLSTFVKKQLANEVKQKIINLMKHPKENSPDDYYLWSKIGQLWLYGLEIDWAGFSTGVKRNRIPLPGYPFEHQRFWIDGNPFEMAVQMSSLAPLSKKQDIADWFYISSWERSLLPSNNVGEKVVDSCWLVFADECSTCLKLAAQLKTNARDVIIVNIGSGFKKLNNSEFFIDPHHRSDYDSLFKDLRELKKIPSKILHFWSWSVPKSEDCGSKIEKIDTAQDFGFFSLINITQAIEKQCITDKIEIIVLTDNIQGVTGEEMICPEKVTVLGALRVIPQEIPNIKCFNIDVCLPRTGGRDERVLIKRLLLEFHTPPTDIFVAYRKRQRLVQTFKPVKLEAAMESNSRLKKEGVYVITGGLGNVGLALAEHLARNTNARLILIGRSSFPAREKWETWLVGHKEKNPISYKIRKIQQLEAGGAGVLILSADVSNKEQMQTAITQAENRFGRINGVIHAAGIVGDNMFHPISGMTKQMYHRQFQPKVYGLLVLEEILMGKKIDFCLLTSSIAAVLGGLGFAAYSAANIFMDAFVQQYNKTSPVPWISVNWDGWQFQEEKDQGKPNEMNPGDLVLTSKEGARAFQRILACGDLDQIFVSTGDLNARIDKWVKLESIKETGDPQQENPGKFYSRPDLSTPFAAPTEKNEKKMAEVWQQFFQIELIGIHDNFFELGGDSLNAVQVVYQLKEVNINLTVDTIFLHQTIHEICSHLFPQKDIISIPREENENIEKDPQGNEKNQISNKIQKPGEEAISASMDLKHGLTEEEKEEMLLALDKNDRLTISLKENKVRNEGPVSPGQRGFLFHREYIARKNILFFYDFTHPVDESKIKIILREIINENCLFRSVIEENGENYTIKEFDSFANFEIPMIDISGYSIKMKKEIMDLAAQKFQTETFNVIGDVLYRLVVFKTDSSSYHLTAAFNHLIFDGESGRILEEKIRELSSGKKNIGETRRFYKDYFDYINFLNNLDYKDINLENYVPASEFIQYQKKYLDVFPEADLALLIFEVDISLMNDTLRNLYNEIVLLCYAKLLSHLFRIEKVPLTFVSNGRRYKNGNFSKVIGDFHDSIPALFSFNGSSKYQEIVENFISYRKYIKAKSLNFSNFYIKKYAAGLEPVILNSPLIFNSHIGAYEAFKNVSNEVLKNSIIDSSPPLFNFEMTKDLHSNKLLIYIVQNFGFKEQQLIRAFKETYSEIVRVLNESNLPEIKG